ncbi:MAG: ribonuclease HII [Patescibacteria group bacterium]
MVDVATHTVFDNLKYEKSLWDKGVELIAGVDEVGRGALAGPMVVGAVIFKASDLKQVFAPYINNDISSPYKQIKDSKLLSPKKRTGLSAFIIQNCLCYSFFQVSAKEIDSYGISACTQKAFFGAVKSLKIAPDYILTDAFAIKAFPQAIQTNIVSGDRVSITISAASIIAKVFRDKLMCDLRKLDKYICYGFEKHKGYGTKLHIEKIVQHGISDLHRKTFIHF